MGVHFSRKVLFLTCIVSMHAVGLSSGVGETKVPFPNELRGRKVEVRFEVSNPEGTATGSKIELRQYDADGKRLNEDVISYRNNRYVGVMEDCSQRNFFPNSLAFQIYAQTLFDVDMDYEAAVEDYLSHTYGEAKDIVRRFFEQLEEYMPQRFVDTQHTRPVDVDKYHDKAMIPSLQKAVALCEQLDKDLAPYRSQPQRVQTVAVRLLGYYTRYLRGLAGAFILKCTGDDAAARQEYNRFLDEFGACERDIEPYYDHYLAHIAFNPIFNSGKLPEM